MHDDARKLWAAAGLDDWQRPLPPHIGAPYTPPSEHMSNLGYFLEHPGGVYEALPADHQLPDVVVYARERSHAAAEEELPIAPRVHWPEPYETRAVRQMGAPYRAVPFVAPQPTPQFVRLVHGKHQRTERPAWPTS